MGPDQRIEEEGGMTKAIEKGIPKRKIEESAAIAQAKIDNGSELIIGVNSLIQEDDNIEFDILEVDTKKVYQSQIDRINQVKETRDEKLVLGCLEKLTKACKTGSGNLLDLAVDAARARATLGEISFALESVFGRHKANNQTISGVYSKSIMDDKTFKEAKELSDNVAELLGRRARILIAKLGQDGHDRGARIIATGFADLGFDVDIGPLFQTPAEAVKQAIENDVHFIGISSLAAGHKTLVPEVIDELKSKGRADIAVIVGGVIPPNDYDFLYNHGVLGIFGPGTILSKAAKSILSLMYDQLIQAKGK